MPTNNWWNSLEGVISKNTKGQPILKMSPEALTGWARQFGEYSGDQELKWNDIASGSKDTWGKKFINWSQQNAKDMSKYWNKDSKSWNWNSTTTTPTTPTTPTREQTKSTWNSNPYNFSAQDIRNYGSVSNLYNQYAAAASNNDFGNGYLAYLHDRYGNTWGNNLDRTSFENTLRTNEGMNGGIRGRDYQQGFNSYQTWLADRNAAHANQLNTTPKKKSWINSIVETFQKLNYKTGGKLMNYYQDGGAAQDPQQQIIALVQAAAQGDQQAQQTIQQIQSAAESGDQKAVQIMQIIQQVMEQMQGEQAQAAKFGAKLAYIKHLKGECPEGSHLEYFKAGGQICKRCAKDAVKKDCKGSKIKKACGGATAGMNLIKAELGNKIKKVVSKKDGDKLPTAPDASEAYAGGVYTKDSRNLPQKIFSRAQRSSVSSNPKLHKFPRVITQIVSGKDTTYTEVPATDSEDIWTITRKASNKDKDFSIMKKRFQQAVNAATQKK